MRGERGYGFSVHGHNPVYITEVAEGTRLSTITSLLCHHLIDQCLPLHSGLPAHESDIQVGDIIVEVESTDVTRANGDLVVSIVRFGSESLHIILL